MVNIPDYFYLNGKLYKRLQIIQSDSSVWAFCYQEEKPEFLPLVHTRKHFKKAFTLSKASSLMNVSISQLRNVFKAGLYDKPEESYDTATLRPKRAYINEDDMLEIRQILWDLLPKNKYGIPYRDTMTSQEDLIQAMRLEDSRDYVKIDGDTIRIYRA